MNDGFQFSVFFLEAASISALRGKLPAEWRAQGRATMLSFLAMLDGVWWWCCRQDTRSPACMAAHKQV